MHYPHKTSKIKRARSIGFRARMRTKKGRQMINRSARLAARFPSSDKWKPTATISIGSSATTEVRCRRLTNLRRVNRATIPATCYRPCVCTSHQHFHRAKDRRISGPA